MIDPSKQRNPIGASGGPDVAYWHEVDPEVSGLRIVADLDAWERHQDYHNGSPALAVMHNDGAIQVVPLRNEAMAAVEEDTGVDSAAAVLDDLGEVFIDVATYARKERVGVALGTLLGGGGFMDFADTQLVVPAVNDIKSGENEPKDWPGFTAFAGTLR